MLSVISEILLLVEEVRPRRSEVDNLGASIAIFFEPRTLKAVEGVADSFAAANDTLVLIIPERALVTDPNKGGGSDIAIADRTFAITLVA